MLPWFISILIQLCLLQTPEEWNTLSPEKQQEYESIIITIDEPA